MHIFNIYIYIYGRVPFDLGTIVGASGQNTWGGGYWEYCIVLYNMNDLSYYNLIIT